MLSESVQMLTVEVIDAVTFATFEIEMIVVVTRFDIEVFCSIVFGIAFAESAIRDEFVK